MVKMCSNNLFGDGSIHVMAAAINAADGRVLVDKEMSLPRRGGECLTFRPAESIDVLGVFWSLAAAGAISTGVQQGPRGRSPRCKSSM
jgi:hypothetical protein